MEVSGQPQVPAALTPGKCPHYPLNTRLGGPRASLDVVDKYSLPLHGFKPRIVQPTARALLSNWFKRE